MNKKCHLPEHKNLMMASVPCLHVPAKKQPWFTIAKQSMVHNHNMVHNHKTVHGSQSQNSPWFTITKQSMVHNHKTQHGS